MLHESHEWLTRIKAVETEHTIVRFAVDRLWEIAKPDPTVLRGIFKVGQIGETSALLEGTYIVRLFAEFETGLRSFWATRRDTHPRMEDLLNSIASSQGIADDDLKNAHKAREYRNGLVHERDEPQAPIRIADFRKSLCLYFHHLPPRW